MIISEVSMQVRKHMIGRIFDTTIFFTLLSLRVFLVLLDVLKDNRSTNDFLKGAERGAAETL